MTVDHDVQQAFGALRAALRAGTGVMDANSVVLAADDTLCRMLGWTAEELLGRTGASIVVTSDREVVNDRSRERRLEHRVQPPVELTVRCADGSTLTVESQTAPLPDGRWVFLWRDVSEAAAMRLAAQQLRDLVEHLPLGVVVWDASGIEDPMDIRLQWANPAAREAFQIDFDEYIGQTVLEMFPQSRRFDDGMRALLLRGTTRVEHFPDLLVGDRHAPSRVYTRDAIALPGDAVAFLLRDVTNERADELRRRRLLERIVDTSDAERRELAMSVHDDSVQQIAAATMLVEALRRSPPSSGDDDRLTMMESSMRAAMASLRRLVFELSPPELVESGIEGALRSASDYLFIDTPTRVSIDVLLTDDERLDTAVETAAFRIAAEALTNVRKHAQASHVDVRVADLTGSIDLVVVDDGIGFDRVDRPGHIGVRSMIERAASVGGTCTIDGRPWGTVVHAVLPRSGRHGGPGGPVRGVDWLAAAELSPRSELDSVRLENDSLREANRLTMERATEARRRLSGVMSLWQVLASPELTVDDLLQRAAEHIADTIHDGCWIRRLTDDGVLRLVASWHPVPEQRAYLDRHLHADRAPQPDDATTAIIDSGRPVIFDRRRVPWKFRNEPTTPVPLEPRFALVVPWAFEGRVIGTISVVRDRTDQNFQTDDEALLQMMADALAGRVGPVVARADAPLTLNPNSANALD